MITRIKKQRNIKIMSKKIKFYNDLLIIFNFRKNEEEDSAIILMSIQNKKTGKEKNINDISNDKNKVILYN